MHAAATTNLAVDLTGITRRYGTVDAVAGVSLQLAVGSITAITGASGSGKSTLLNIIGGLDVPTSGNARVLGDDLGTLDETARSIWRRRGVGFVFQAYHLLPTMSCADNVALPLHVQRRAPADIRRIVAGVLADVGLTARATHVPDELSGGERQRVAIARALAAAPRLLLADEPTGNLDSRTGDDILTLLLDVTRARAATLVLVTHNEAAAARCDRRVALADGRIVDDTATAQRHAASA